MPVPVLIAVVALALVALLVALPWARRRRLQMPRPGWAFDASPVAMAIVDPTSEYRLVEANPRWFELFGHDAAAVGRNGFELQLWVREQDRSALIARLASPDAELQLDAPLRHRDGRKLWCRIRASHVQLQDRRLVLLAMQDIQAQRELETDLRDSQAVALQIFDVVPEPLLISDAASGEFIDVNRAWADRMGYTKQDVIGKTSRDINLWADLSAVAAMGARFARDGQVDGEQLDMRHASGEIRHHEISARQWQGSSRRLSIWIARDVTEQRRAEQALKELNATLEERVQLRTRELADALAVVRRAQDELVRTQRLSSLGALVAGVAHELNTPIGNAVLSASTLEQIGRDFDRQRHGGLTRAQLERFTGTVAELAHMLLGNLQRAVELINGFKQLAVDQSSYQRRQFGLRSVVDEVLLSLRPSLRRTQFKVEVEIDSALQMDSFPGPLGQVLINLINNAVLHAFEGRSEGRILVSARLAGADELLLTVEDDGCGIPAMHLGRIFDPFFTTRLGQGGSGLGLHICFSLVNGLLGGSISAGASPLGGAAFTLRLPRVAPTLRLPEESGD